MSNGAERPTERDAQRAKSVQFPIKVISKIVMNYRLDPAASRPHRASAHTHTHTNAWCNLRAACLAKNSFDFLFRQQFILIKWHITLATVFTCIKRDMKSCAQALAHTHTRTIQTCGKWFSATIVSADRRPTVSGAHTHRHDDTHTCKKYQSLNWSFIIGVRCDRCAVTVYWNAELGWLTHSLFLFHPHCTESHTHTAHFVVSARNLTPLAQPSPDLLLESCIKYFAARSISPLRSNSRRLRENSSDKPDNENGKACAQTRPNRIEMENVEKRHIIE